MNKILSFEEAICDAEQYPMRHLILGNGFSIGCFPEIFDYSSLFDQVNFEIAQQLQEVFRVLKTHDFEIVIKALERSRNILPIYLSNSKIFNDIENHANQLKKFLIQVISAKHPHFPSDVSEEKYQNCQKFLKYFLDKTKPGMVYTLNYDLLLYWVLMHDKDSLNYLYKDDGFGNVEDDVETSYLVWPGVTNSAGKQRIHFLHGAMHLFDAGHELKKYSSKRKGISIVDQVQNSISNNEFPLFVSEATSEKKLSKIKHHDYLSHSYRSLSKNCKSKSCFFIYGHSLSHNDNHILERLAKGSFPKLYVSIYGNPESDANKLLMRKVSHMRESRSLRNPLAVSFYDATSAKVWG
ncbi:MAG: DUF4917 domain-containing protein [Candidatus Puniceispirillum sp.]|nr:DUF4917 domain-containing protein [Candidatus Puniceispirillum sp.]